MNPKTNEPQTPKGTVIMADLKEIVSQEVRANGGIELAKDFGRSMADAGSWQLLTVAYAVVTQADAMPSLDEFTPEEHEFLSVARSVIEAYTFTRPVKGNHQ